jgi:hypothetical protein
MLTAGSGSPAALGLIGGDLDRDHSRMRIEPSSSTVTAPGQR